MNNQCYKNKKHMVVNKKGNSRYILYSHRIHLLIVPLKIRQNEVIVPTILVLPLFFPDEIRYRHTHKLILFIHTLIDQQYDSQASLVQQKRIMLQALWNTGHIRDALHRSLTSINNCFYHLRLLHTSHALDTHGCTAFPPLL